MCGHHLLFTGWIHQKVDWTTTALGSTWLVPLTREVWSLGSGELLAVGSGLFFNCVTRAPLLYFIRSWVALSFKVCQSVSESVTPDQLYTLCNIKKGIDALYWPSIINYQVPPPHSVLYWPIEVASVRSMSLIFYGSVLFAFTCFSLASFLCD